MSNEKIKVHVWYIDGTDETFYAEESYSETAEVLYWQNGDLLISIPVRVIKKIEEQ